MSELIGVLGASFLVIAWIAETYKTFKAGNVEAIDLKFVLLSIFAAVFLAFHSWIIQDLIFLFLNLILMTLFILELVLVIYKRSF